jgi:hypothetical protein
LLQALFVCHEFGLIRLGKVKITEITIRFTQKNLIQDFLRLSTKKDAKSATPVGDAKKLPSSHQLWIRKNIAIFSMKFCDL